jgi:amidase
MSAMSTGWSKPLARSSLQRFPSSASVNTYSRFHDPIGSVASGEPFAVETMDCYGGKFRGAGWGSRESHEWVDENLNVVTGPIEVRGARPGQAVAVRIRELAIISSATVVIGPMTAFSPDDWWLDNDESRELAIEDGCIALGGGLEVPVRPVIGCIASAPRHETIRSIHSGTFGGNQDCNLVTAGSTVVLPVETEGALLYFGDGKARMGDGEIVHASECAMNITAEATAIERPSAMSWPRIVTGDEIATVVSNPQFADAGRQAFRELLLWVESETALSRKDAAVYLGMMAEVRVCQLSNLLHTASCVLSRDCLGSLGLTVEDLD